MDDKRFIRVVFKKEDNIFFDCPNQNLVPL